MHMLYCISYICQTSNKAQFYQPFGPCLVWCWMHNGLMFRYWSKFLPVQPFGPHGRLAPTKAMTHDSGFILELQWLMNGWYSNSSKMFKVLLYHLASISSTAKWRFLNQQYSHFENLTNLRRMMMIPPASALPGPCCQGSPPPAVSIT